MYKMSIKYDGGDADYTVLDTSILSDPGFRWYILWPNFNVMFVYSREEHIVQYSSLERPKRDGQASINSHLSHHIYINRSTFTTNASTSTQQQGLDVLNNKMQKVRRVQEY